MKKLLLVARGLPPCAYRHLAGLRLPAAAAMIAAFLLLLPSHHLDAQVFGKNKVQYDTFTWYYIQSDHFDVYFTEGGDALASFTARAAEDALVTIQADFRYRITSRIPIVVYNSHNDFQQTNVVGVYMEEGIGGVTELFKNRVVIPFEGSYKAFRHVIHHELVHAVINDMFYGGSIQAVIANSIRLQLPLWFNEGMSEYQAHAGWDTNSDMFMRDAATSNYLPPIPYLGGYFAYRGGQSVWWYISEKYGRQKIGEIMNRVRGSRNLDQGFKAAIGLNIEELSERWMKEQKVIYWPDVAKRTSPADYARRLTNHTKLQNFYNTSPAISPSGDRIAFISDRDDYFSVYVMSTSDEKDVKKLVEGQTTNDFEELHLLTPGLSWSPDGKRLALASKSGPSDAIHVIDVETGRRETLPPRLDGIFSVAWSPDGNMIAYVGNSVHQSDIWVYDLRTKSTRNLTSDIFSDAQPSWSPDSRTVYFTSDRGSYLNGRALPPSFDIFTHDYSQMDVYAVSVDDGHIRRLTDTPEASESFPTAAADGQRLLFISDRNGINNLYVRDLAGGADSALTNSITGVYQISMSADGNKLAFASMYEAGFDIFLLRAPLDLPRISDLPVTEYITRRERERTLARVRAESPPIDTTASRESITYVDNVAVSIGEYEGGSGSRSDSLAAAGAGRLLFSERENLRRSARASDPDVFSLSGNIADDGSFVVNKYKISFSPDLVYGNAGYNTFYGVLGTTEMAFSDMLGNHQIFFLTNLIGDLKNSDYALTYLHLPGRIDWGVTGFHSARFLFGYDESSIYLYRYRQYGLGLSAQYPIDRFNRIEGALTYMNISQENLDLPQVFERGLLVPNIAWVHDNSLWGTWAPVRGSRYELRLFGSPGLGNNSLEFASAMLDYRKYYKFWQDFSFVLRGAAGGSFGRNPQRFFIGGTENWINRTFEEGRIPIDNVDDYAFLTPVLPLRGYNYNARIARYFALGNAELRFPLVKYFLGGVLPYLLQTLNAAMFVDVGTALDKPSTFRSYAKDLEGRSVPQDLLVGTGVGARMWFLGFPLRFDVAWSYLGDGFSTPKYYFSLGAEF